MTSTMRVIKIFSNGQSLVSDSGRFDSWCMFIQNSDGTRKPPRDADIFFNLVELGKNFGTQKVYMDIKEIFDLTRKQIDLSLLNHIYLLSQSYGESQVKVEILYSTLYVMFIAEENKDGTKLGKRIKLLGIHQILKENIDPETAANFTVRMPWKNISKLCEGRGF